MVIIHTSPSTTWLPYNNHLWTHGHCTHRPWGKEGPVPHCYNQSVSDWWDGAIRSKMTTGCWFEVGFWWSTGLESMKVQELVCDLKFVYYHKPMSHHKICVHLTNLPKSPRFFFRTNWFRFNRNYRAFHSAVTFSWTFLGPPKYGVLLYNFFPFRIFLENFCKGVIIAQTPLASS